MNPQNNLQGENYGDGFDYEVGSPHLRHQSLNGWIIDNIRSVVLAQLGSGGSRVLEIGAGHGTFTEQLAALGAQVTVTEMSEASASVLHNRFRGNANVRVVFDPHGDATAHALGRYDLVLAVSVLHHIPDYLAAVTEWTGLLDSGGVFLSFQDPLWYPRRSRVNRALDRSSYLVWRLGRGDLRAGLGSVLRRATHRMDESNARDMVEYHVLRSGCDEDAIIERLRTNFAEVQMLPYWSTQAPLLQCAGELLRLKSTFGVLATGHR